ncbi:MAG: hypothetical protein ABFS32_15865 [Bacteroidota bacterium]
MKNKLLLIVMLFTSFYSFGQKIVDKLTVVDNVNYPVKPIPLSYNGYKIVINNSSLFDKVRESVDISYMGYNETSELTISLMIFNDKMNAKRVAKGDQVTIMTSVEALLGYVLHEGEKVFHVGMVNLFSKEYNSSTHTYDNVDNNVYDTITVNKSNANEYIVYVKDLDNYALSKKYGTELIERESKLLIEEAGKEIKKLIDMTYKGKGVRYLGLKKHTEEDEFKNMLKERENRHYNRSTPQIEEDPSVMFWLEKTKDTNPVVQAVAQFNVASSYTYYGEMIQAKNYYDQLQNLNVEIPKKSMNFLAKNFEENYSNWREFFDEKGKYSYNTPLKVKQEGWVIFKRDIGATLVSKAEYNEAFK